MMLGLWALVSFELAVIIDFLKPVKTTAHPIPEAEIAALRVASTQSSLTPLKTGRRNWSASN